MKVKSLTAALSLLLLMSSGCTMIGVGVASAVGGTYYISGEIKASYPTSIYHLYRISLHTLKQEKIKVISVENTKKDADIVAEYKDGSSVKIHIYYNKEGLASIGIRVGPIGDEKRSRALHKKMKRFI